jgi:putative nucleotidyltransferase with HDIG domain
MRRGSLFLAALYHDIAKPKMRIVENGRIRFLGHDQEGAEIAARRARAMALSNEEVQQIEGIVREHMRILYHTNRLIEGGHAPTRRAIYRFFRDTGEDGVGVCLLALADMRATFEHTIRQEDWGACLEVVRLLLENWYERHQETVKPQVMVDGNDLMRELDIKAGPRLGELLEMIREAQAAGEVNTRDQALALARKNLEPGKPGQK